MMTFNQFDIISIELDVLETKYIMILTNEKEGSVQTIEFVTTDPKCVYSKVLNLPVNETFRKLEGDESLEIMKAFSSGMDSIRNQLSEALSSYVNLQRCIDMVIEARTTI